MRSRIFWTRPSHFASLNIFLSMQNFILAIETDWKRPIFSKICNLRLSNCFYADRYRWWFTYDLIIADIMLEDKNAKSNR